MAKKDDEEYVVVWSGRMPLLPEREERTDSRMDSMPSYEIDDDGSLEGEGKRQYNKTGRYAGKFSRTDPAAKQYKPKKGDTDGK